MYVSMVPGWLLCKLRKSRDSFTASLLGGTRQLSKDILVSMSSRQLAASCNKTSAPGLFPEMNPCFLVHSNLPICEKFQYRMCQSLYALHSRHSTSKHQATLLWQECSGFFGRPNHPLITRDQSSPLQISKNLRESCSNFRSDLCGCSALSRSHKKTCES